MSSSALRAAWEAAQKAPGAPAEPVGDGGELRRAWEAAQGNKIHEEYASGNLAKRMARENANEREVLEAEPSMFEMGASRVLNAAQGMFPGMRTLQAGIGAIGPRTFAESRDALDDATGRIPTGERIAGQLAGGALTAGTLAKGLPKIGLKTPAKAGAALGAADQALSADDMSGGERIGRTLAGGVIGGGIGKALSLGRTGIKSLRAKDPAENLVERATERAEFSGPLYDKFRNLGDLGPTPKLQAILDLPIVKTALTAVQGESPELARLPATDAKVLDAVYKRVGDKAFRALHGVEPTAARQELGDAIERAANLKGGSYKHALDTFSSASRGMEGVEMGRDLVNNAVSAGGGSTKAALTKSPAAITAKIPKMAPNAKQGLQEGLYGQIGRRGTVSAVRPLGLPLLPVPSKALLRGDQLANEFDPVSTEQVLRLLGLANAGQPLK